MHLPPSLVLGEGNVQGTMQGSHMAPDISSRWDLPAASASGTADFSRDLTKVTCKAPAIDISGALHVVPPDFDAVKKATTQAEISALAAMVSSRLSQMPLLSKGSKSSAYTMPLTHIAALAPAATLLPH